MEAANAGRNNPGRERRGPYHVGLRSRGGLTVPRTTAYRLMRQAREANRLRQEENIENVDGPNAIPVQVNPAQPVVDENINGDGAPIDQENLNNEEVLVPERLNEDAFPEQADADNNLLGEELLQADELVADGADDVPLTCGPRNIQPDAALEGEILPNMRRTKFETLLLILNFSMRHGLSSVAVEDLCTMINVIIGGNIIPTSRYLFKKTFSSDMAIKFHMYCSECVTYIGQITEALKRQRLVHCPVCDKECNVPGLNGKDFFVTLPVKTQIADMLQTTDNVLHKLNYRWERDLSDDIRDVFDGQVYKNLCQDGKFLSHRYNLSLTFNTDGASVFESGCTTMWPIFFRLNELEPKSRFDESNSMLAALWFGKKEPNLAMYFKSFLEEAKELHDTGINWRAPNGQVICSKIITLNCVLDSVAKPMLQSIKKFNGSKSCPYCDHPGVTFGLNNMSKWPMRENLALFPDLSFAYTVEKYDRTVNDLIQYRIHDRDNEGMRRDMITAEERRPLEVDFTDYNGLKGLSAMCYLPFFDVCVGFQIDYLHAVLLGTCKHLASLWFDSPYKDEPFSVRERTADIDQRLLAIRPPTSISRRPRSLNQKGDWHANEWRSWLLYYSLPCLKGILPSVYYKHHCILVSALHTMLRDAISKPDLESATWELGEYVLEFQKVYSPQDMYFNVHLLLHLGKSVKLWGPLWCYSMFSFESGNNTLIKLVKGTTGVASQIVSKYSIARFLPHLLQVYEVSEDVMRYCSELMCYGRFSNVSTVGEITLIGNQKHAELNDEERRAFTDNGIAPVTTFFERMMKDKILYHARNYTRAGPRSDNSVVHLRDGTYAAIIRIMLRMDGEIIVMLRTINVDNRVFIAQHACGSKARHIKTCSPVVYGNLFFTNATNIISNAIIMACGAATYIAKFPNVIEKD